MNDILLGNCLEILPTIEEDYFIITDPPYNQGYHYNEYKDSLGEQEYRDMLYEILNGKKSVVIHFPEETLKILATLDIGELKEVVSWVYPSNTNKQSRLITWWNCKPDFKKIPQPYKNPTDKRIAKRIAEGKSARGYDWWEINQVKNVSKGDNAHPCPIPLEVARRIILSTTEIGDLVVDPFAGGGTVCLAAQQLGRRYIGIETSQEYVNLARASLPTAVSRGCG